MDWSILWAMNKKRIDRIVARYTAIPRKDAVIASVNGIDTKTSAEKPKHAKYSNFGMKRVLFAKEIVLCQDDAQSFAIDEEVTLMNWGNAIVRDISTDPTTGIVLALKLDLNLQGDFKNTEKKVTWLANDPENKIPVELVSFDYLIIKDKIEKDDDLLQLLADRTEFRTEAWADCNVSSLAQGEIIQCDRTGYFRVDRAFHDGQPAVFFNIPTGKQ